MAVQPDLSLCIDIDAPGSDPALAVRLMASLSRAADDADIEVIVLHPAGVPWLEQLEARYPGILLYETGPGLSLPSRLNLGLAVGRGRYLAAWPASITPLPHALYHLVSFLDDHGDVGLLAPALVDGHHRPYPTVFRFPCPGWLFGFFPPGAPPPAEGYLPKGWFPAQGPLVMNREMLRECGLFQEGFRRALFDTELAFRARRRGWHLAVEGKARALCDAPPSPASAELSDLFFFLACRALPFLFKPPSF